MEERASWPVSPATAVRIGLAVFVLAWLLGPSALRSAFPIWLVFLVAVGLEVNFFVGARRAAPPVRPDRRPQAADRERFGYSDETDDLIVVRDGAEELWIPYAGESDEELDALIAEAREDRDAERAEPSAEDEPPPLAPPRRPRPLRRLATGLAFLGVLATLIWAVESRTGWSGLHAEARAEAVALFSAEASRIAGKPVSIHCDEAGEHVGVVQHADGAAVVGGNVAWLTPERCHDLYRLAFDGEVKGSQTGRAIAVLAHEAWHLRGLRDEGVTECYAVQSGVELGRRLGLSEEEARRLMRQRLVENVLHRRGNPEYLVPAECRAGGSLDLGAGAGVLP
jgi:hypothetical protein